MKRFGWQISDRGAIGNAVVLALGGTAGAGLLIGGLLGFLGGLDLVDEPAQTAAAATASFYDCPDGEPLGTVTRGDRVFITGRDDSGSWVQVRSPLAVSTRAWIRATHVLADSSTVDFPVLACHVPVEVVVVSLATTTTTEAPPTTDTTAAPPTTDTTAAPPPTTGTTVALPSVSGVSANPAPVSESYFGQSTCNSNPGLPSVTTISAAVGGPAGVQSVTMSWQVGGLSGSTPMAQAGGQYQATLGPFDAENPDVVSQGGSLPITVTVTVIDGLGRSASAQTAVTLNDCTFG